MVVMVFSGEKDVRILLRELFDDRLFRTLRRLGGAVAAESCEKTLQQPLRVVRYGFEMEWLDELFCRSSGNWTQEMLFGSC